MSPATKAFAFLIGLLFAAVVVWTVLHPVRQGEVLSQNTAVVSTGLRVDLNSADAAMLELLPGVGPGIAQHIIEAREGGAVFERAADLEPVKFIGPSLIKRVGPWVVVGRDEVRAKVGAD